MHRVELKVCFWKMKKCLLKREVPNAPCGVESRKGTPINRRKGSVPNAPCGVESPQKVFELAEFLSS